MPVEITTDLDIKKEEWVVLHPHSLVKLELTTEETLMPPIILTRGPYTIWMDLGKRDILKMGMDMDLSILE